MPKNIVDSQKTILLVEDEDLLHDVISKKLVTNHFDVRSAKTFEEALDILNEGEEIDAIWLDHYLLGKHNGMDLVYRIKHRFPRYAQTPIFVVSNSTSTDVNKTYTMLGASKYYTKSNVRLNDVVSDIKRVLR